MRFFPCFEIQRRWPRGIRFVGTGTWKKKNLYPSAPPPLLCSLAPVHRTPRFVIPWAFITHTFSCVSLKSYTHRGFVFSCPTCRCLQPQVHTEFAVGRVTRMIAPKLRNIADCHRGIANEWELTKKKNTKSFRRDDTLTVHNLIWDDSAGSTRTTITDRNRATHAYVEGPKQQKTAKEWKWFFSCAIPLLVYDVIIRQE